DAVNRILNVDVATYLCDDILVKVDRMSMAHSLEVRAPLLDHKLVEFVAKLPPAWKLTGGGSKVLLRSVLDGMVPRAAFDRPKHGFVSPIAAWLRVPRPRHRRGPSPAAARVPRGKTWPRLRGQAPLARRRPVDPPSPYQRPQCQ